MTREELLAALPPDGDWSVTKRGNTWVVVDTMGKYAPRTYTLDGTPVSRTGARLQPVD